MTPVDTLTHGTRPTIIVDGLEVELFATEEEALAAFAAVPSQEFVHLSRLKRPLKPVEPPRRLGSPGRRFPTNSRRFPTDSQVLPDSICYNRWQVHPSTSTSARWCGLPSLVDVGQETDVEQQAAAFAAESGKEQHA